MRKRNHPLGRGGGGGEPSTKEKMCELHLEVDLPFKNLNFFFLVTKSFMEIPQGIYFSFANSTWKLISGGYVTTFS